MMECCVGLALPLLILASLTHTALATGLDGTDFIYYCLNSTDYHVDLSPQVRLNGWTQPNVFGTRLQRVELDSHAFYPPESSGFYLRQDSYWMIYDGHVSFGPYVDGNSVFSRGEMVWLAAGVTIGPLQSHQDKPATVLVVSNEALDQELTLAPSSIPKFDNPTIVNNNTTLAFHRTEQTCYVDSGHTCRYAYPGDYPLADFVMWGSFDHLKPHYHPRGSYYFNFQGNLYYGGDREGLVVTQPGDIRWVRPGFYYTLERTDEDGAEFLALHESTTSLVSISDKDSWVSWDPYTDGVFVMQKAEVQSVVFSAQDFDTVTME